jgi:hypothetical protein
MPPEMLVKRFFAKTYGWTEAQIEEASLDALTWFPAIEEAESKAVEWRQKQEASAARHQQQQHW